jgi:hypothetical protein
MVLEMAVTLVERCFVALLLAVATLGVAAIIVWLFSLHWFIVLLLSPIWVTGALFVGTLWGEWADWCAKK